MNFIKRHKLCIDQIDRVAKLAVHAQQDLAQNNSYLAQSLCMIVARLSNDDVRALNLELGSNDSFDQTYHACRQAASSGKFSNAMRYLASHARQHNPKSNVEIKRVSKSMWPKYRARVEAIEHATFGGTELEEESFDGLVTEHASLLVACDGASVLGFSLGVELDDIEEEIPGVQTDPARGHGTALYVHATEVHPAHQSKGIGYLLREHLLMEAARRGFQSVSSNNRSGASLRNALRLGGRVKEIILNYFETKETYGYVSTNVRSVPKLMPIPRVKQQKDYTCGPASLRCILLAMDRSISEEEVEKECKTTAENGTAHEDMCRGAKRTKLNYTAKLGGMCDIEMSIRCNEFVIVNYFLPKEDDGHYSVVHGFDKDHLFIMDVQKGKTIRYPKQEFERNWYSKRYGPRWMMSVRGFD